MQARHGAFLGLDGLAQLVAIDGRPGGSHLAADRQAAGFGHRIGQPARGGRVGLVQCHGGRAHFFLDLIQVQGQFKLPVAEGSQVGQLLRQQVFEIAGQRIAT